MTIHIGDFKIYTIVSKNTKKVYLVCDEGVAVSDFCTNNANFIFKWANWHCITTEQFKSVEDIAQVDVVITTNDDLDGNFDFKG